MNCYRNGSSLSSADRYFFETTPLHQAGRNAGPVTTAAIHREAMVGIEAEISVDAVAHLSHELMLRPFDSPVLELAGRAYIEELEFVLVFGKPLDRNLRQRL